MDLAGGHFYTSGSFWGPAGVIVGLLAIGATVWVTLRAANPKRRLYYWMFADTPLITRRTDLSHELTVTYGTRQLNSPHVVNVKLTSRGRRDIAREVFDGGEPLCLDIGIPIVECVKVSTWPLDRPDPTWAINDSKLLVGPSHFGRRQTTVFALLVDGESPGIAKPQQSLVDVEIRHGDVQAQAPAPLFAALFYPATSLTVVSAAVLLVLRTSPNADLVLPAVVLGVSVTLALAGLVANRALR